MPATPKGETPSVIFRQPRIQIPSALPSLLQTELLFLDRLLRKNKSQHRSSVFFQKSTHVFRLAKRLAVVIDGIVKLNEAGSSSAAVALGKTIVMDSYTATRNRKGEVKTQCYYNTLAELVDKSIPAITKASEVLETMINHLHFLPLITTLLAITSRIFVIIIDIGASLLQYRDALQKDTTSGSSTPISGAKDKDKVSFSFQEVVEMVIRGKMTSSRVSSAQGELRARMEAMNQQSTQGKGKESSVLGRQAPGPVTLEVEGEDFGEAVGEPIARAALPLAVRDIAPRQPTPIIIDSLSSPEEPRTIPLVATGPPMTNSPIIINESSTEKEVDAIGETATTLATQSEKTARIPIAGVQKRVKRPIHSSSPAEPPPSKKKKPFEPKSPKPTSTVDKGKAKKKKGKDAMDDIFGL
ncbi:hypothetical protein NliqN6_4068 [Naganishia liquefaciens]|uniref:Nucleolus and neural progenitor protein-like N-terminal domain-containing protein n=1 Tax=Naganishia liquefaciens TaxID=104408 RepID=A0A8H3TVE9_9TREE|nr:hypothetical protein NliqN6_4068 [Naganishia liquefaciens]